MRWRLKSVELNQTLWQASSFMYLAWVSATYTPEFQLKPYFPRYVQQSVPYNWYRWAILPLVYIKEYPTYVGIYNRVAQDTLSQNAESIRCKFFKNRSIITSMPVVGELKCFWYMVCKWKHFNVEDTCYFRCIFADFNTSIRCIIFVKFFLSGKENY
jgi:hypothetical protein